MNHPIVSTKIPSGDPHGQFMSLLRRRRPGSRTSRCGNGVWESGQGDRAFDAWGKMDGGHGWGLNMGDTAEFEG